MKTAVVPAGRRPELANERWLFPPTRGDNPSRAHNVLRRVIQPAAEKPGITHVTWHLPRHLNSTTQHRNGLPLKVAQERLGHARAETTMAYYTHVRQPAVEQAAEVLSGIFTEPEKCQRRRRNRQRIVSRARGARG